MAVAREICDHGQVLASPRDAALLSLLALALGCDADRSTEVDGDPVSSDEAGGLDEEAFDAAIELFLDRAGAFQDERNGGLLSVDRFWDNDLVPFSEGGGGGAIFGGSAKNIIVVVVGGLARSPVMTPDGFLGVLCHEFGHGFTDHDVSSPSECRADYFGVRFCLRAVFDGDTEANAAALAALPAAERKQCLARFSTKAEEAMCGRVLSAGIGVFDYLEWLRLEFADIEVPGFEERNLERLESMHRAALEKKIACDE